MKKQQFEKLIEQNQQELRQAAQRGEDAVPYLERNKELIEAKRKLETRGLTEVQVQSE
jgi:hypothetical protein